MSGLHRVFQLIRTVPRLGAFNVIRVANYRLQLKRASSPIRKIADLPDPLPQGPFFKKAGAEAGTGAGPVPNLPPLFGHIEVEDLDNPPDWLANPITGEPVKQAKRPFYQIPDFDPDVGDIKQIWELSRFDWLLGLATHGSDAARTRINDWLADWVESNPAYQGPNWKCGQEASIRVLHLIAAAACLGEDSDPQNGLVNLIRTHLRRIAPTVSYAKAQDNNHGTSEAAALYVGGRFLSVNGHADGDQFARQGREFLEDRTDRLIGDDGGFSQYSVTYHRVMLDTLSASEWYRRRTQDTEFSNRLQDRLSSATLWLRRMTDDMTGDAPNMGANDGAHLFNLAAVDYRDFRPSVAMACALWRQVSIFAEHPAVQAQFEHLGLARPSVLDAEHLSDPGRETGFAILRQGSDMAILRHANFRFRPAQCDLLHLDVWYEGRNILRDAGTYSYNSTPEDLAYFTGVQAHNTIQFDDRDQMSRLGRFLYADWLRGRDFAWGDNSVQAGYRDRTGCAHTRHVTRSVTGWLIEDVISGYHKSAILRWRLEPDLKHRPDLPSEPVEEFTLQFEGFKLIISAEQPMTISWEIGAESLYYLEQHDIPVLAITAPPGTSKISTRLEWN